MLRGVATAAEMGRVRLLSDGGGSRRRWRWEANLRQSRDELHSRQKIGYWAVSGGEVREMSERGVERPKRYCARGGTRIQRLTDPLQHCCPVCQLLGGQSALENVE